MKRRDFLKAGSAGMAASLVGGVGLLSWTPRAHAETIRKTFYITDGYVTQGDGNDIYFRGFSSSSGGLNVPGEHLIVQQGDRVEITIDNTLGSSHSFVIDGISDNPVNSGRISGGSSTTVSFTADNVGTFVYYDSRNAPYNRVTGLHGGIAVMPANSSDELYPGSPTFVQQQFWIFNQTDPDWNNAVRNGQTPNSHFTPRYFTLNGLSGRPPGAAGSGDPSIDSMHDPRSALHGHVGDRTLVRMINAGIAKHAVHTHGNHMEWLTSDGDIRPVWEKDIVPLNGNMGTADIIYPFARPPDAWPPTEVGTYPMHLHDEMTQTAGGGLYMFGSLTDIFFE